MLSKILALSAAGFALAAEEGKNPIRRVVTLMQDMQKEIEAEGEKEDDMYKKFECYCKSNNKGLSKAGEDASAQIEELAAKVKEETAEKKQTEEELKQHKLDRRNAKEDLAKATSIRKKEHETFVSENKDATENISATKGAIETLEKGMGASSFIQTPFVGRLKALVSSAPTVDASDKETLMSFLTLSGDYVPASGQIVGILKDMLDNMEKSLGDALKSEEAAAASYKELKAAKEKEIELATTAIEAKITRVGELAVSIVQNKNAQKDATADLEDSQKFLANLAVTCKDKKAEYEERVKVRQEEINAISEAISVLNDDDALDVFKASLSKPKQSFLQKGSMRNNSLVKAKAMIKSMNFSKSPALALMASAISHKLHSNNKVDFSSVIKMIDDMVALLSKEQKDDETHKDYCNEEFDKSEDEKKALEQKLTSIRSSISSKRDEIASLTEKISTLNDENAALDKSMSEATEQRGEENKEFTDKVTLNKAAIELIFKAKNRLQKFYNPDQHVPDEPLAPTEEELSHSFKVAPSFVQIKIHNQQKDSLPDLEPAPEVSLGGAKTQKSNSVMALMDQITKELEMEIQEAELAEKTAVKEYKELMTDAADNKAANTKAINDKTKSKADLELALEDAKTKDIITADQLETLKAYISDLHASCDFIVANFEVRREARTSEIEGLKSAKAVLNGASYSF